MKPYETVTLRSVHVTRVESVRVLGKGTDLKYSIHLSANDQILQGLGLTDVMGDLIIEVPRSALDDYATVIVVSFKP